MLIINNFSDKLTIWCNVYDTTKTKLLNSQEFTLTPGNIGNISTYTGYYLFLAYDYTSTNYIMFSLIQGTDLDTSADYNVYLENAVTTDFSNNIPF